MAEIKEGYLCENCDYFYPDQWGAQNCCPPDKGFGCSECNFSHVHRDAVQEHIEKWHKTEVINN